MAGQVRSYMRSPVAAIAAASLILIAVLSFFSCDVGQSPIAPKTETPSTNIGTPKVIDEQTDSATMILSVPLDIAANENPAILVQVFNSSHNPVVGKDIYFSAQKGIIPAKATTDSSGKAEVIYSSILQNAIDTITAKMNWGDSVKTSSAIVKISGTSSPKPGTSISQISADSVSMTLSVPLEIAASETHSAPVTVRVFDVNHNPVTGKDILFSTKKGFIPAKATTDSTGKTTVNYSSIRENTFDTITARLPWGDSVLTAFAIVKLSGIAVSIAPASASSQAGTSLPITISLLDGAGVPISGQTIRVSGAADTVLVTGITGKAVTTVTRSTAGKQTVIAGSTMGTADTAIIDFWTTPPTPSITDSVVVRKLLLFSSRSQLRADNSDQAAITALVTNDVNNPQVGVKVQFATDLGVIDQFGTTNEDGRAAVTLRSTQANGNSRISAWLVSDTTIKDSTVVLFSGVTLELTANQLELRVNDTATVQALLKDGSGNPIGSKEVLFTISSTAGTFSNGTKQISVNLDPNGKAAVKVSSLSAVQVVVSASSVRATGTVQLRFTTNNLVIAASKPTVVSGGLDSALFTATYRDNSGNPIAGATILFATNAGTLSAASAVTTAAGVASTWLKSADFSATATVQAKGPDGNAYATVEFIASAASSIALAISPDNISIKGGVAGLVAIVRDAKGNTVSGAQVSFRILKGPGGGEYIDKPVIVTTTAGIARAQVFAGTLPSMYRGCEVEARVATVADTSKLTISGEAHTITISRPEDDTVKVPKGGILDETTFEYYVGAVVKDINGNPVADGTKVNFSSVVSGMAVHRLALVRWEGLGSGSVDDKALLDFRVLDVIFEDVNDNKQMDPGIDLKLDYNDAVARRGDDVNGDGVVDYDTVKYDFFWDFNRNGKCDVGVGEPWTIGDNGDTLFADLNANGYWDRTELDIDHNGDGICDLPPSGDFRFALWEMYPAPNWRGARFDFDHNEFAVVIDRTAETKNGVAYASLTYPRQMARRLYATVNAEANGIRDRDGERFIIPVIRN